jgi:uncharacterized protein YdhG (YjbR/CyaY superfamily)
MKKPANTDEYIASFPKEIQTKLQQFRGVVKDAAPQAEEVISYGIPAFRLNGMLVWFAAHTHHIGFYPRGSGIEDFKEELSSYKVSKGTVQFPFDRPLPLELIKKIVKFRVEENLRKVKAKNGVIQ